MFLELTPNRFINTNNISYIELTQRPLRKSVPEYDPITNTATKYLDWCIEFTMISGETITQYFLSESKAREFLKTLPS